VLGIYCRTLVFDKGLLFVVSTQFIVSKVSFFFCLRIYPKVVYAFVYVTLLVLIVLGVDIVAHNTCLLFHFLHPFSRWYQRLVAHERKKIGFCLKVVSVNVFSKIRSCV
jgi:hypothetical protein